jgi:lipopolysaccharide export system permease protein
LGVRRDKKVVGVFVRFRAPLLSIRLSQLNKVNVDDNNLSYQIQCLPSMVGYTLDSLQKNLQTEILSYSENNNLRTGILNCHTK